MRDLLSEMDAHLARPAIVDASPESRVSRLENSRLVELGREARRELGPFSERPSAVNCQKRPPGLEPEALLCSLVGREVLPAVAAV